MTLPISGRKFAYADWWLDGKESVPFAATQTPNGVTLTNTENPRDSRWLKLEQFNSLLSWGDIVEVTQ